MLRSMRCTLSLISLLVLNIPQSAGLPSLSIDHLKFVSGLSSLWPLHTRKRSLDLDTNPNGSTFIWVIQDTYEGQNFFECVSFQRVARLLVIRVYFLYSRWDFYTAPDPTQYVFCRVLDGWLIYLLVDWSST